jgi:P4 family phage/plasmid primase-like protien
MTLTLDQLLREVLGYTDDEFVSISTTAPGRDFSSMVVPVGNAQGVVDALSEGANVYHGVNPIREGVAGRGKAGDVTRLSALWADIDHKDSGAGNADTAAAIVTGVSAALGMEPAAVVSSGGGLHPYWGIADGAIGTDEDRAAAQALLDRFKVLVKRVAESHGGGVDSVFDLPRVLRTPGTTHLKDPNNPRPVIGTRGTGTPLTLAQVAAALDAAGIPQTVVKAASTPRQPRAPRPGSMQSAASGWTFATEACEYALSVIKGWGADVPSDGRHQWLLSQMTRLSAMHRRGCLTAEAYDAAYIALDTRFHTLCAEGISGDVREVPANEVSDAAEFGRNRVEQMDDADVDAELGGHIHMIELANGVTLHTTPVQPHRDPMQADPFGDDEDDGDFSGLLSGTPSAADLDNHAGGDEEGKYTLTDSGMADLLVARHRDDLRYCADMGRWIAWNGVVWSPRPDDTHVYVAARETVDSLQHNGTAAIAKFKTKNLAAAKLSAVASLARRNPRLQIEADELDTDGYMINTLSGVVDLRTGGVVSNGKSGFHTKLTGTGYDPDMPTLLWDDFLQRTFGGDGEMIAYVQRLAGLSIIGQLLEQIQPFLHGAGANGKSVLLDTLYAVVGEYALNAPSNFLTAGRAEKHETEIARLRGARMVVASEVSPGSKFDEEKIKTLTGNPVLSGRFMRGDIFDFRNTITIWLTGNHKPAVSAGGHSFWRRLRLIPFNFIVPPDQQVKGLSEIMVGTEGPGILSWIVEGALDYQRFGLADPPAVKAATAEYEAQEDHVGRFTDECLVVGGGDGQTMTSAQLAAIYHMWCKEYGEKEMPVRALGRELEQRFNIGTKKGTGGTRLRTNVAARPDAVPGFLLNGLA